MTAAEQFAENTAAYIRRRLASERDEFDIIRSVLAYLNWRVESVRVRGLGWRNQPVELGCYVHAINLINQAQSRQASGASSSSEQTAIAFPKGQSNKSDADAAPPKKEPASIVIPKSRKAHA